MAQSQDPRQQLANAMARKVVAARENARRVKRPGTARPMRPIRPLSKKQRDAGAD